MIHIEKIVVEPNHCYGLGRHPKESCLVLLFHVKPGEQGLAVVPKEKKVRMLAARLRRHSL